MFGKLFDTLANMGIWIRFRDPRSEPPAETGRVWGPATEGFAMSIAENGEKGLSVLIRNLENVEKRARIQPWLAYLNVSILGPDGSQAPLRPFGRELLKAEERASPVERVFPPGHAVAAEIPIDALYDVSKPGEYRIVVSCPVPGATRDAKLTSNELVLKFPR